MQPDIGIRVDRLLGVLGELGLISQFSGLLDGVENEGKVSTFVQIRRLLSMATLAGTDIDTALAELASLDAVLKARVAKGLDTGLGSRTRRGELISDVLLEYLTFAKEEGIEARLETVERSHTKHSKGQTTVTFGTAEKPH